MAKKPGTCGTCYWDGDGELSGRHWCEFNPLQVPPEDMPASYRCHHWLARDPSIVKCGGCYHCYENAFCRKVAPRINPDGDELKWFEVNPDTDSCSEFLPRREAKNAMD